MWTNGNGDGHGGSIGADALKGALAGAAAVWVMDRVDWFMFNREDPETGPPPPPPRPDGLDPAHVMADMAVKAVGKDLTPAQPNRVGASMHYNLGVGPGALYSVLLDRVPVIGTGRGLLYGLGLFLAQDEALNAMVGFSGRPGKYPWQDHARGLISHVVYGFVMDAGVRALKKIPRSAADS